MARRRRPKRLPTSAGSIKPAAPRSRAATSIDRTDLGFPPDKSKLYVVESNPPREIHVFDVTDNGTKLANKRLFIDPNQDTPDGFRVDVDGNLWCG